MPHCNKKMLSFFLTTRCNLCCRYCYNEEERLAVKEHTLSVDIAKGAIDWYFANNSSRHIRFYGPGEPSCEFFKLKEITEYAKSHPNGGDRVIVEIQTNGIWTQDVLEWALDNLNIVWMSFDGMRDIQDRQRPIQKRYQEKFGYRTSGEVLESNVQWLNDHKGHRNLMVGARVTITSLNVERQKEMVDYFYDLGIRYVWTDPELYTVNQSPKIITGLEEDGNNLEIYTERYIRDFHFDLNKYLDLYLEAYKYAKQKGMFWGSFFSINFDGYSDYHCRSCTPLQAPHITPDGYISACDMVVIGEKPYHMEAFIVGKWDEQLRKFNLYQEKIDALNNRKSTVMKHCLDCEAKMHCGGYCLGETLNETGSLIGYNPLKCEAVKKLFAELGTCEPYPYLHP